MAKFDTLIKQFEKGVERLDSVLQQEKNEFIRDSAIQRFEFSFELGWKTIKALLEEKGIRCYSPRDCFREAFQQGLIDYDDVWLEIVRLRNQTTHLYNEEMAEKVYERLEEVLTNFKKLLNSLKKNR